LFPSEHYLVWYRYQQTDRGQMEWPIILFFVPGRVIQSAGRKVCAEFGDTPCSSSCDRMLFSLIAI